MINVQGFVFANSYTLVFNTAALNKHLKYISICFVVFGTAECRALVI